MTHIIWVIWPFWHTQFNFCSPRIHFIKSMTHKLQVHRYDSYKWVIHWNKEKWLGKNLQKISRIWSRINISDTSDFPTYYRTYLPPILKLRVIIGFLYIKNIRFVARNCIINILLIFLILRLSSDHLFQLWIISEFVVLVQKFEKFIKFKSPDWSSRIHKRA